MREPKFKTARAVLEEKRWKICQQNGATAANLSCDATK
jgi:hypothetical protein